MFFKNFKYLLFLNTIVQQSGGSTNTEPINTEPTNTTNEETNMADDCESKLTNIQNSLRNIDGSYKIDDLTDALINDDGTYKLDETNKLLNDLIKAIVGVTNG